MSASSRRAVITGLGVITALGHDVAAFWESLAARRGGIRRIRALDVSALPIQIAGEVPDFDARKFVEKEHRKGLKTMARSIQLAVAAAQRALEHGKVDK